MVTSARRSCLPSKSKIPPKFAGARAQVLQIVGDEIELFGFHDFVECGKGGIIPARRLESLWNSFPVPYDQLHAGVAVVFVYAQVVSCMNVIRQRFGIAKQNGLGSLS